jgi:hypothetical protein
MTQFQTIMSLSLNLETIDGFLSKDAKRGQWCRVYRHLTLDTPLPTPHRSAAFLSMHIHARTSLTPDSKYLRWEAPSSQCSYDLHLSQVTSLFDLHSASFTTMPTGYTQQQRVRLIQSKTTCLLLQREKSYQPRCTSFPPSWFPGREMMQTVAMQMPPHNHLTSANEFP